MADFPRLLKLSDEVKSSLKSYLNTELLNHRAERTPYLQRLMEWQNIYWAEPSSKKRTFPFDGACNLIIPLSAIAIETVHSKHMTTMFALNQFVSAKAQTDDWSDVENSFEQWFDHELQKKINIYDFCNNTSLENVKFGNCVGKSAYEYIERSAVQEINGVEKEVTVVTKDTATADAIPLARFMMPFAYTDPQTSPWVGEEHSDSPFQIQLLEQNGFFEKGTYEALKSWVNQSNTSSVNAGREFDQNQQNLENRLPSWPKLIDWCELYCAFNIDENPNEKLKEVVIYYHIESQLFMGVRYNWTSDLRRPYRIGKYFPIEHRWTAVGICKQNDEFQKEITIQHRQRIDNATLANTRMFKINRNSGYGPGEPIFPGKMWFLDDMTHMEPIEFGEVYTSAFNNEQATLIYAQQRTGVDSMTLGMEQAGTPGTATSDLAKLQQARGKGDFYFKNYKNFVNEIITDVACNIHQFGPRNLEINDLRPDVERIKQFFQLPETYIREGLIFDLKCVGQADNRMIDRQNWVQLSQFLQQYYDAQIALASQLGNPALVQAIVMKGLIASTEAMKQISESFELRNISRLIVDPTLYQNAAAPVQGGPPAIGNVAGGSSPTQALSDQQGVGGFAKIISQFAR